MCKLILALALSFAVVGCVTGDRVRQGVREGMSKADVIAVLGNPDGFQRAGEYEALGYSNRLISGWSWDRADYTVILQNGLVVAYGAGQVRKESPNVLVLVPAQ